jgi:hypothetical protein
LLKNLSAGAAPILSQHLDNASWLSAAEKRDYEAVSELRQALYFAFRRTAFLAPYAFRPCKSPTNRFVCQQQRNEIMTIYGGAVNAIFITPPIYVLSVYCL